MNRRAPVMVASPLGRYGFTGSRLYWARFSEQGGQRFVVKTHEDAAIREELLAVLDVRALFEDAELLTETPIAVGGRSAIIYKLWEYSRFTIREFRETVFNPLFVDDPTEDQKQALVLKLLYESCLETAHQGAREDRQLGPEYLWYMRDDMTAERLAGGFNREVLPGTHAWFNTEIPDPRMVIEQVGLRSLSCRVGAVHGDLHPNNIVFDRHDRPHLIDFAWASAQAHVIKDYVLMENSLRFLLFPNNTNPDIQLRVDTALLQEDGTELLESLSRDCPHAAYYRRLGLLLRTVRAAARDAGGEGYDFDEFLHSQFIVLYGLLKYDAYRFHDAVRALGLIGSRLL